MFVFTGRKKVYGVKYYRHYFIGGFVGDYQEEEITKSKYLELVCKGVATFPPRPSDDNYTKDYLEIRGVTYYVKENEEKEI